MDALATFLEQWRHNGLADLADRLWWGLCILVGVSLAGVMIYAYVAAWYF